MPGRLAVRNPTKKETIGLPARLGFRRCTYNPISLNVNALETPRKKDPNTGRNDIGERERGEGEREVEMEFLVPQSVRHHEDLVSPNFYVIMKIWYGV